MKKNVTFFAAFLILTFQQIAAQNVGIGTSNPTQKLDVAGNVNISGTIMANGTTGANGQVLTSTGSGMAWSTVGAGIGYKKSIMFTYYSGTWTVPAGVTEIMIELWGAGSGGTINVGGTSGGYLRAIVPVTPGASIAYTIGTGGDGGNTTSASGANTFVTIAGKIYGASGGSGVFQDGHPGQQMTCQLPMNPDNYYCSPGVTGESNFHSYGMKNATTYVETIQYGRGGAPVGMINPYPNAGDVVRYENGLLVYKMQLILNATSSSGGPAGTIQGHKGGDGMVVIWWN